MLITYLLIFAGSCILLYFAGEWVIEGLMKIARFLGWKEFVVAFVVMAFASSLPNLFIGIFSALQGIPQLSFGDIAGNNFIDVTLTVALAVFFAKGGLPAQSRTVQMTSIFTAAAAILPVIMILDGWLSRFEGVLLICFFLFYVFWLFSKKERFTRVYDDRCDIRNEPFFKKLGAFFKDMTRVLAGIPLLLLAAHGIVQTSMYFVGFFNLPIILVGILITSLGTALPEIYFAVASAKRGETWMILGDLMGSVIYTATLVLGIVAVIHPIQVMALAPIVVARFFLIMASLFFLFCVRSDGHVSRKEAVFLLMVYIAFLLVEILVK